jgi:hypothetical protein
VSADLGPMQCQSRRPQQSRSVHELVGARSKSTSGFCEGCRATLSHIQVEPLAWVCRRVHAKSRDRARVDTRFPVEIHIVVNGRAGIELDKDSIDVRVRVVSNATQDSNIAGLVLRFVQGDSFITVLSRYHRAASFGRR